jgi:hypothetical protein
VIAMWLLLLSGLAYFWIGEAQERSGARHIVRDLRIGDVEGSRYALTKVLDVV